MVLSFFDGQVNFSTGEGVSTSVESDTFEFDEGLDSDLWQCSIYHVKSQRLLICQSVSVL